ncbi:MAG TPA: hypothetical protein VEV84_03915 [Pyrinomonadaceae bacterium]|nr:hypothetical protein [Pyrinomonadaceae bacterium]
MSANSNDLGRLIAVYGVSPLSLQRAVIVAVLAFLFFLTMMFAFYIRQTFLYFLLATAFLIVYLVMMISILSMRRAVVKIFEKGFEFKKQVLGWADIASVRSNNAIVIETINGEIIGLPATLTDVDALQRQLEFHTKRP